MTLSLTQQQYWRKNLRVTALMLALWFAGTFVVSFYARELRFSFWGWPFSFWLAAQGSLVLYCAIVWFYARYMRRLDETLDVEEGEGSP